MNGSLFLDDQGECLQFFVPSSHYSSCLAHQRPLPKTFMRSPLLECLLLIGERKKPINIQSFGGTPPGVRPVCPGDTSHLSRDMSRLSRGHSVPLSIDLHINQAQMSQVSLGRPEFVPGTPPGHPTAKFLYVIFLYRFFSLHIDGCFSCEKRPYHDQGDSLVWT